MAMPGTAARIWRMRWIESSIEPCESETRATSIPAAAIALSSSGDSEAGPMVATIRVRRPAKGGRRSPDWTAWMKFESVRGGKATGIAFVGSLHSNAPLLAALCLRSAPASATRPVDLTTMRAQRSDPGAFVDIIIMILLLVTAILAYRGIRARAIISLWGVSLVATLLERCFRRADPRLVPHR